jgi:hypothetical protein
MTTDAMLIDCDGHILEPPDLWETYLENWSSAHTC